MAFPTPKTNVINYHCSACCPRLPVCLSCLSKDATEPPQHRVAINGFGRIGRLLFRCLFDDPTVLVVQINDICSLESAAYLLKYDSVHGTFRHTVDVVDGYIVIDGDASRRIKFSSCATPTDIAWCDGVRTVCDCTGVFLTVSELVKLYLTAPSPISRVIVSAPIKEAGALNVVLGCNENKLTAEHRIITNASCTTNCLGPIVRVVKEAFGIKHGCITTVHNVTGTQTIVDMPNTKKSDLRRARSGMLNLCPTSTGSATAIIEIYPELKGKLNGLAIRVPLLNASITDCVFELDRPTTAKEVNAVLKAAAEEGELKGILGYEEQPLVSTDYTGDPRSAIVDAPSTMVIDGTCVKIYAWYDNEFGYSKRMAELVNIVLNKFGGEKPGTPSFEYMKF